MCAPGDRLTVQVERRWWQFWLPRRLTLVVARKARVFVPAPHNALSTAQRAAKLELELARSRVDAFQARFETDRTEAGRP